LRFLYGSRALGALYQVLATCRFPRPHDDGLSSTAKGFRQGESCALPHGGKQRPCHSRSGDRTAQTGNAGPRQDLMRARLATEQANVGATNVTPQRLYLASEGSAHPVELAFLHFGRALDLLERPEALFDLYLLVRVQLVGARRGPPVQPAEFF